jgi:hypothetical protein
MFFDAKEYHAANKQVANILSSETATNKTGENSEAGKTETKEVVEEA